MASIARESTYTIYSFMSNLFSSVLFLQVPHRTAGPFLDRRSQAKRHVEQNFQRVQQSNSSRINFRVIVLN